MEIFRCLDCLRVVADKYLLPIVICSTSVNFCMIRNIQVRSVPRDASSLVQLIT